MGGGYIPNMFLSGVLMYFRQLASEGGKNRSDAPTNIFSPCNCMHRAGHGTEQFTYMPYFVFYFTFLCSTELDRNDAG
jgi:hypothetical protein